MRAFRWTNPGICVAALVIGILAGGNCARADFRFGTPVNLGSPPNSIYADVMPSISRDGLEVYFWSNRPGGFGDWDLWMSTRASTEDEWLLAENLGREINSSGLEAIPCISADGLELFFSRGSAETADLMVAQRTAKMEPWGTPNNLGPVVNSSVREDTPRLTSDGLELYFISNRAGGRGLADIWVATRPTITDDWRPPVNLSMVNSSAYDQWVNLSGDGLTLLFQSTRSGGEYGGLYMSTRKSKHDPWTAPVYLGLPMGGSVYTLLSSLSADGTKLYLSDHINYPPKSGGAGGADMWQVPVVPIVDFTGDGTVDGADIRAMVDQWETDDLVCDIGPMPWGDGIVDVEDLKVLAGFIGESVTDPTLIAHWGLDETEGAVAYDSAGEREDLVMGSPTWQPTAGVVDGALEFDGATCVTTSFVFNPADGAFSVLAWVKGGTPGQVILSQLDGDNWLGTDAANGFLMTELRGSGRDSRTLCSETVIADGNWHHIGFAWNGIDRRLYVDNLIVAEDTQAGELQDSAGGLNIGCNKDITLGTFWTGLVDDIRIYHRAVKP